MSMMMMMMMKKARRRNAFLNIGFQVVQLPAKLTQRLRDKISIFEVLWNCIFIVSDICFVAQAATRNPAAEWQAQKGNSKNSNCAKREIDKFMADEGIPKSLSCALTDTFTAPSGIGLQHWSETLSTKYSI